MPKLLLPTLREIDDDDDSNPFPPKVPPLGGIRAPTDNTFVVSAGLRWVLLMLQRQAHSRNRPTATDEKTGKVFSVLVVICLVGVQFSTRRHCCSIRPSLVSIWPWLSCESVLLNGPENRPNIA